jgi:hypothetical protein
MYGGSLLRLVGRCASHDSSRKTRVGSDRARRMSIGGVCTVATSPRYRRYIASPLIRLTNLLLDLPPALRYALQPIAKKSIG